MSTKFAQHADPRQAYKHKAVKSFGKVNAKARDNAMMFGMLALAEMNLLPRLA